jgi:hypothetical protein
LTFKYTVFLDGSITHYMDEDEHIEEAEVFNTLPQARARALALMEADCARRLAALTHIKSREIDK